MATRAQQLAAFGQLGNLGIQLQEQMQQEKRLQREQETLTTLLGDSMTPGATTSKLGDLAGSLRNLAGIRRKMAPPPEGSIAQTFPANMGDLVVDEMGADIQGEAQGRAQTADLLARLRDVFKLPPQQRALALDALNTKSGNRIHADVLASLKKSKPEDIQPYLDEVTAQAGAGGSSAEDILTQMSDPQAFTDSLSSLQAGVQKRQFMGPVAAGESDRQMLLGRREQVLMNQLQQFDQRLQQAASQGMSRETLGTANQLRQQLASELINIQQQLGKRGQTPGLSPERFSQEMALRGQGRTAPETFVTKFMDYSTGQMSDQQEKGRVPIQVGSRGTVKAFPGTAGERTPRAEWTRKDEFNAMNAAYRSHIEASGGISDMGLDQFSSEIWPKQREALGLPPLPRAPQENREKAKGGEAKMTRDQLMKFAEKARQRGVPEEAIQKRMKELGF
jgi:hypothetical protein